MKVSAISSLLAVLAVKTSTASAPAPKYQPRQASNTIAQFYFEGAFENGKYADFTQCVPEDGNAYQITSQLVVYSIIPDDSASSCIFVGADGTLTHVEGQIDVLPQPYISVTCGARTGPIVTSSDDPFFTKFFPTISTTCVEPTGTRKVTSYLISSSVPPLLYPTGYSTGTGAVYYPIMTGYSTGGGLVTPTATAYKRDWRQGLRA